MEQKRKLVCYLCDIGIWPIKYLLLLLIGANKIIDRQALIVQHPEIVKQNKLAAGLLEEIQYCSLASIPCK